MFERRRVRKSIRVLLLIAIIIIAIILIGRTLARYETTATSDKDVDVAFWVIDNDFKTGTVLIKDIYPSNDSFDYTFSVSNFEIKENGGIGKRAETDLEYELTLTATTNLPLEYQIEKNGQVIDSKEEIITDQDGTYYKKFSLGADQMTQGEDTTDKFVIKVKFPRQNVMNENYADLIEYVKLDLNAKQITE